MAKLESSCHEVESVSDVHNYEESTRWSWTLVRQNYKVILYSIGACVSSMLWGFDIGVNSISTALPGFKLVFGYEYHGQLLVSATWNALWTAMTSLGMLIGGLACGTVSDRFGRRVGYIIGSACSVLGVGIEYAATTPGMLLAGKIVNGLALGFFLTLAPVYASEIAPIALRPALIAAVNLFINAGQMMSIGIGNTRFPIISPASYKVLFAAQWAFPVFLLVFVIFMPESPWYLVRKNQEEAARKSLIRLHSNNYDVSASLREILDAVQAEKDVAHKQSNVTYIDCFKRTDFRRTRIACGMFVIQQFTGIAFYAQALYFLGVSGLPIALTFKLALGGFAVAIVGNIASWFIMDYVGRRPLLLIGVLLNASLLVSVGVAGCFTSMAALYYIGYVMNFAQLFYAPTVGAVSWTVSAEVSSVQMRVRTQSLATMTNALVSWIMNFITPYLINPDTANLGGKAAFLWGALSILSFVWVWFEVPEIKGRSFSALDSLFESGTPTRQFKSVAINEGDRQTETREDSQI